MKHLPIEINIEFLNYWGEVTESTTIATAHNELWAEDICKYLNLKRTDEYTRFTFKNRRANNVK